MRSHVWKEILSGGRMDTLAHFFIDIMGVGVNMLNGGSDNDRDMDGDYGDGNDMW